MSKKLLFLYIVFLAAITLLSGCSYEYLSSLKPRVHTVKASETLYAISRQYNVPIRTIVEQNSLKAPYILQKGQKLEIPRAPIHTVKKGETLYSIAQKYDVNLNTLIKKNKLIKPYNLSIGQKLLLPADFNKNAYSLETTSESSKKSETKVTKKVQQTQPEKQKAQTKVTQAEKQKEIKQVEKKDKQPEKKTTQVKKSKTTVATLPDPPKRSGKFIFPVKGQIISDFGVYGHGRRNDGINISAKEGTPFNSAEHGVVAYAGNELKGFGNLILVKHSDGWISAYAHAKDICVEKGKIVKQGEVLGHVGSTGNVKTPQLHFEIYKGTKAVNPMNYLKK